LAWVHLRTDSFTETGGPAALNGRGNSDSVGYGTLGARAATMYVLQNGMALMPRASVAWQHALGDVTPAATLAFGGVGAFGIAGVPIARDAALVSAGADLRIAPRTSVGFAYVGELAGNAHDQSIKGNFTLKF
jgi:outer membrane autotransporter protein